MSLAARVQTEALARKKKVRHGWVYIHRTPTGPPPPANSKEEALADLMRDVAVNFDFSPIFSGDRRFAQKVAEDFVRELRAAVSADASGMEISVEDLEKKLNQVWPWWYRAILAFRNRIHTATNQ
jgi:broad specificity phosphatase PhoE